jgi:eukaryotic-like serine/threonine-protein kinase
MSAAALAEGERPLLEAGTIVGRYRILRRIGAGAMSEVYLAVDEQLGRRAALKVLGARHQDNTTVRERFVREARALAHLSHPNLITVYEAGRTPTDKPYFAMELLEGGDTQKLLEERGPLPSGVVALIGAQAAAGLGEAARAQIIHRDVKPANLGISAHGVLKVTDFGLAKAAASGKNLTGEGLVVGTADYIAPEQARGEEVDERADVYALGCTLFHLLTGKPPFRSENPNDLQRYVDVMRAHLSMPVPDPRRLAPATDPELADLVMRLMGKHRDRRPTFDELAPMLSQKARRLSGELPRVTRKLFTLPTGSPSAPEEPVERAVATPSLSEASALEVNLAPSSQMEVAVSRWPQVAGAVVLLAAGVGLALAFLRH